MKIYAYKQGSASALALAAGLGCKVLKREGSKWKPKRDQILINWGCSELPHNLLQICKVLNNPAAVKDASNKLQTFKEFTECSEYFNHIGEGPISFPEWTEDKAVAEGWLDGKTSVVARQKLTGHSGEGIVIATEPDQLVDAPLYVKYVKKSQEYRVHVLHDEVVDVQRKARRKDVPQEQVNWQVRNHANGFIYAREGFETPQPVLDNAVKAVEALGLDFGAVDVIWNDKNQMSYVLEVNTAPGLTGATLEGYVKRFKEIV